MQRDGLLLANKGFCVLNQDYCEDNDFLYVHYAVTLDKEMLITREHCLQTPKYLEGGEFLAEDSYVIQDLTGRKKVSISRLRTI